MSAAGGYCPLGSNSLVGMNKHRALCLLYIFLRVLPPNDSPYPRSVFFFIERFMCKCFACVCVSAACACLVP